MGQDLGLVKHDVCNGMWKETFANQIVDAPAAQGQDNARLSFRHFYERLRNAANNEPQVPAVAGNEALSNPPAPNLADERRFRADFARPPRARGPAAERRRAMREEETIRIADEQERYHEQRNRLA